LFDRSSASSSEPFVSIDAFLITKIELQAALGALLPSMNALFV
jgi:hypothetical protein